MDRLDFFSQAAHDFSLFFSSLTYAWPVTGSTPQTREGNVGIMRIISQCFVDVDRLRGLCLASRYYISCLLTVVSMVNQSCSLFLDTLPAMGLYSPFRREARFERNRTPTPLQCSSRTFLRLNDHDACGNCSMRQLSFDGTFVNSRRLFWRSRAQASTDRCCAELMARADSEVPLEDPRLHSFKYIESISWALFLIGTGPTRSFLAA